MKRIYVSLLLIIGGLAACQSSEEANTSQTEQNTDKEEQEKAETEETSDVPLTDGLGYYAGDFEPVDFDYEKDIYHENKITISIDSLNEANETIYGHSIVAGNKRPFKGTYEVTEAGYVAKVREPGDDPYDGVFNFTIDLKEKTMTGTWDAFQQNASANATKYTLEHRIFIYDPALTLPENVQWARLYDETSLAANLTREGEALTEDVLKVNPSLQELTNKDIENLTKGDLEVIRNSIYARHGYSFKNRKMRFVFDHIDWYMPVSTDVRNQLTALELKNIDLLTRYEQHAARYYDSFGR
ncbi:MAG: YARHG domain-containing protein [Thermonemataceae bacterium]